MKRYTFMFCFMFCFILFGCGKKSEEEQYIEKESIVQNIEETVQESSNTDVNSNMIEVESNQFDTTQEPSNMKIESGIIEAESNTSEIRNVNIIKPVGISDFIADYFVFDNNSYDAIWGFIDEIEYPEQVKLLIEPIKEIEGENIYFVRVDYDEEFYGRDYYGIDRMDLGYFLVTYDVVYFLTPNVNQEIPTKEEFLDFGHVVLASEDRISEMNIQSTEYESLEWNENRCEFKYVENNANAWFEHLVWEKDKGLIVVRNGFGVINDTFSLYKEGTEYYRIEENR